ncbi:MAG: M43 family zinc metalloprotease [Vicingaceae bacterium]|nr:M43 family zinc metalloprotease [Vicingaceae bacterium]
MNYFKITATLLLATLLFSASPKAYAQIERTGDWCGSDHHYENQIQQNPSLIQQKEQFEAQVRDFIQNNPKGTEKKGGPNDKTPTYIIPVVFHIVTFNGQGHVSKQDIDNAMLTLNEDFRRLNNDASQTRNTTNAPFAPVAIDAGVEFRLAHLDPNGNCTEGIVRVESPLSVEAGDAVKNVSRWNTKKYFNIWSVVSIAGGGGGGIIAGYAQFPWSGINNTYGVVMNHQFINRNDRTLTHEVGHCFGLLHTFQGGCSNNGTGGGDMVADTPPVQTSSFGCPTSQNLCTNVPSGDFYGTDVLDQIENYMSYNSCQNMFSAGQKVRMDAVLTSTNTNTGLRQLSVASNLAFTGIADPYGPVTCTPIADFTYDNPMICVGSSVTYTDNSYNGVVTSYNWIFNGGTPANSTAANPTVTYNTPGVYNTTHQPGNSAGTGNITKNNIITVSSLTADYFGVLVESFENATTFNNDFIVLDPTGGQKFQRTTSVAATGSASVELRNFLTSTNALKDELITPSYDLSNITNPQLKFKIAFARRASTNTDRLLVWWSLDCGETWVLKLPLTAGNITTTGLKTSFWAPTASEWAEKTVDLSTITNETNVRFKFAFESGGGNNFYLDDINIDGITSVGEQYDNISSFVIYPNPAKNNAVISFNLTKDVDNLSVVVKDLLGKDVTNIINGQSFATGKYTLSIDENNQLSSGVYFVQFRADNNVITQKLVIQ